MSPTIARVLVTGSRNWKDFRRVWGVLTALAESYHAQGCTEMVVVHGGATGADEFAHSWVTRLEYTGPMGVRVEVVRADWEKHGRAAGHMRNRELVDRGADACVAFLAVCSAPRCARPDPHYSHGATACRDLAEAADIPVMEIFEESEVTG